MAVCAPQLALALLLPALCSAQFVVRIGYTSFEEPVVVQSTTGSTYETVMKYYDQRGGLTNHALLPNPLENPVAYVACSSPSATHTELGFRSFYEFTRSDPYGTPGVLYGDGAGIGMSDGAQVGVIGDVSTQQRGDVGQGGPAPDGSQYYTLQDTDGFVYVAMDPVSVRDYTGVFMSAYVHVESTTWEVTDYIKVWADIGTTPFGASQAEVLLLSAHDLDQDDANITMDVWRQYSAPLPSNLGDATMKCVI